MSLEISTMLHLSTAHVTPDLAQALDRHVEILRPLGTRCDPAQWQSHLVAERWAEYGWFIWVGSGGRDRMPKPLQDCLNFAETLSVKWIQFDRDCEPIDELPTYDWP